MITRAVRTRLPLAAGEFQAYGYRDVDGAEHVALVYGELGGELLVHVHPECLTGDVFGSLNCNCDAQLQAALRAIVDAGSGVVVYLRGDEQHLLAKPDAAPRDCRTAAAILADLGVQRVRPLTDHASSRSSHWWVGSTSATASRSQERCSSASIGRSV
jgi:GTP cyclohydrolase II